jgi:carboxyl-terminal processing protease
MFDKPKKTRKFFKVTGIIIISLIMLFLSFGAGAYAAQRNNTVRTLTQREIGQLSQSTSNPAVSEPYDFNLYWTVWDTLKNNYVDKNKISDKEFFYGSLKGMVGALGDPYSTFFDPKTNKEFQDDMAGTFEGIGAEIGLKNEIITIISPLDDMPAAKAGLRAGDQIFAVNGTSTAGLMVDEVVKMIRGPKGTDVTLTIFRKGQDKTIDYKITRGVIIVKSVKTEMRKDGIYVIKVSAFNDDTSSLFDKAVKDILAKKPKSILLDLRNNPGGYLDTAVDMASEWVESGDIVIEKFGDGRQNKYISRGTGRLKNYKTVVLVNHGSASASEIVAGALRDRNKATIIGEKTYGKGSVQTMINFADGSAVKVTVAKWLTPNGDSINEVGIAPKEEVKMTNDDFINNKDPQLDRAIQILTGKVVTTKKVNKVVNVKKK